MKTAVTIAVAVLLVAVAAFASQAPEVDAHLTTKTTAKQIGDAKGPLNVKFDIAITNRSDAPVTLKRVEVQTDDSSGIDISDGKKKADITIAPGATETIRLVAKSVASSNEAQTEPLELMVLLSFKGPGGGFIKAFSQSIE